MVPLNDMARFVEVVKAKSFRRAAEAMGMPNSTLSRRIRLLEQAIGLRLLHRTTRKFELTEAGQLYFERCKRIVEEAQLAHEQLGDMSVMPQGVLRASFPVDFATVFLTPLIIEFSQAYPEITFEFDLTPRRVDLVSEPYDVAIRMGESSDSNLVARLIGKFKHSLYASPAYLERRGEPNKPEDLIQHDCLRFSPTKSDMWSLHHREEVVHVAVDGRFRLNSMGMIQKMITQGLGIGVLADEIAAPEVAEGRLKRVLPAWSSATIPVYAMTETRLLPAKTQRFIEFLRERLDHTR
ncbi:LysR family transcriptional regulator [Achromobacter marplatensis]|uniref:LysR family transcriptional regulator n=1 Tax=Achromobacter marplatensis TaxID=470868 RepID=UPI0039F6D010